MWDKLGHCTTCNYGSPVPVDTYATVQAVRIAMQNIAPTTDLLWISAFDSLQEREVPAAARRQIFELVAQSPVKTVLTETHPASVRAATVAEVVQALGDRSFGVGLGTETMDEFVRYVCLNKPFSNTQLARAVTTIHEQGAQAWCNLIVGIPFLTRDEVIRGSIDSVQRAFDLGFDEIVLFPNHVKEYTLAYWLAQSDRYTAPDLWYLRDVLAGTPTEALRHVHLAWLDLKPHPGAAKVGFEPAQVATERLRSILDRFNVDQNPSTLDEAFRLDEPAQHTLEGADTDIVTRLGSNFAWLAETYEESGWWQANGAEIMAELQKGFQSSSIGRVA
jgi:radical SAM enzyme (TIGR01210 family)